MVQSITANCSNVEPGLQNGHVFLKVFVEDVSSKTQNLYDLF